MAPPPVRDATAAAGRRRRRGQVQPPVDPLVMMSVVVVVYNVDRRPSTHASFHAAKRRYADGANGTARAPSLFAAGARFEFVVLHPNMEETEQAPARAASRRTLSTIERGNNSSSSPDQSFRSVVAARGVVRRQTLDVVAMLGDVVSRFPRSPLVALVEDDSPPCPRAMLAVSYLISRAARAHPNWAALRVGFGLNGIILRSSDVPSVADHFRRGASRRPPDNLFHEWSLERAHQDDRPVVALRHNLFRHVGAASSLGNKHPNGTGTLSQNVTKALPQCYEVLSHGMFKLFHWDGCPGGDIWPCDRDLNQDAPALSSSSAKLPAEEDCPTTLLADAPMAFASERFQRCLAATWPAVDAALDPQRARTALLKGF